MGTCPGNSHPPLPEAHGPQFGGSLLVTRPGGVLLKRNTLPVLRQRLGNQFDGPVMCVLGDTGAPRRRYVQATTWAVCHNDCWRSGGGKADVRDACCMG